MKKSKTNLCVCCFHPHVKFRNNAFFFTTAQSRVVRLNEVCFMLNSEVMLSF